MQPKLETILKQFYRMICRVVSWPEPINHGVSVELVRAGRERYRNKEVSFHFPVDVSNYKSRR